MWQVLFQIPGTPIKIYGYGLMLFLAFLGSMRIAAWRAKRENLDVDVVYDLALWLFIGGLAGARAFYVWQYWGTRIRSPLEIFMIWQGGIVFYGSIMGGAAAFFLYWFLRRFPLRPMLDVVAPALAIGIALGRMGCFLNGCCYGDACDLPIGVTFPAGTGPWESQVARGLLSPTALRSLPVHPTQIYAAVDGLFLLLILNAYFPLRRRDGEVMGVLMILYPISRFLVEHLRNDEGVFFMGMTISQLVSVGLLAGAVLYWAYLLRQPKRLYANEPHDEMPAPIATPQAV
ncbi:prolipoprotein diacylglyceryl transferase [Isosphaeraceae bacterium EP7]